MRTSLLGLFPLLAVSLLACGGSTPGATSPTGGDTSLPKPADHPASDKVTWKKDAAAKSCHPSSKGGGDLVAGVTAMANGCLDTKKMHQVGQPTTGEGSSSNMVKSIPLKAQANHCYRFLGLADPAVTDFDIAVIDSAGKSAGEDLTDSNDAVVLEDGAICFTQDDSVNVNAAVAAGAGKWAVEIWSN